MKIQICLAFASAVALVAPAYGQTCAPFPTFPYTNAPNQIDNGYTADASQVWADFNYLGQCAAPIVAPNFSGSVGIGPVSSQFTMLTLLGANASTSGPDVSYFTSADTTNPVFEQLNFSHNNVSLNFDAYYSGGNWKSSSSTANFQIYDLSGGLQFNYASGVSPGSNLNWDTVLYLSTVGTVGINTTDPGTTLDINTGADSDVYIGPISNASGYNIISLNETTGYQFTGLGGGQSSDKSLYIQVGDSSSPIVFRNNGTEYMRMTSAGHFGIGTTSPSYLLQVGSNLASGAVAAWQNSTATCTFTPVLTSPNFSCSSDARLKKDVADTGPALPALIDIRVRDFTARATGQRLTGVIAQELQKTHPDMVHDGPDGFYTVDQPNTWKLVKAIQELKVENDRLRAQVDRQAAANDALKNETAAVRDELYALQHDFAALKMSVTTTQRLKGAGVKNDKRRIVYRADVVSRHRPSEAN